MEHIFAYSRVNRNDDYLKTRADELGTDLETLRSQGIRADEFGNIRFKYFDINGHAIYRKNTSDSSDEEPRSRLVEFERIRLHPDEIPRLEQLREAHLYLLERLADDPDGMAGTVRAALTRIAQDATSHRTYWMERIAQLDDLVKRALVVCNFLKVDNELRNALATPEAWEAHNLVFAFFEQMARKNKPHEAASKVRPAKVGKYTQPKGEGARPYIPPASRQGRRGRPIFLTEGEFKSIAIALAGIPAVSFPGITSYKLCDVVRAFAVSMEAPAFYITYDADAREVRRNSAGTITDGRARDFGITSALKLASDLFEFAPDGMEFKVFLVVVKSDAGGKGIDDVMSAQGATQVLNDLIEQEDPRYFHRIELKRSKYVNQVEAFFGLTNHRDFYRANAPIIGLDPFVFGGMEYQAGDAGDLFRSVPFFRVNNDPFNIPMASNKMHLGKGQYLPHLAGDMDKIILSNPITCISSPPASGKTTFAARMAKRSNERTVIAVPTRGIADQYKKYKNVTILSGTLPMGAIEEALNAPTVVCTYEHLPKVLDISSRILFLDEAQNLARQFGTKGAYFRAEALRQIVRYFPDPDDPKTAKRVVLLSGTLPKTIPYIFGGVLVEVTSDNTPRVNLTALEATGGRKKDLTALLAGLLKKDAHSSLNPVFVIYNDCEALELLATFLVVAGVYKHNEIAILTSPRYRDGENDVFDHIARHEKLPDGIRLVLCTCLLAEGLNIKNKNIGNVYTVGRDHTLILQFVMRFRAMKVLNVFSILPPETKTKAGFCLEASKEIDEAIETGKLAVQFLSKRISDRAEALTALGYGHCLNDILAEDFTKTETALRYAFIRSDESTGRPIAMLDKLQIIADVDARQYERGNNAYCITRLLDTPGWELADATVTSTDNETSEAIGAAQSEFDESRAGTVQGIKDELLADEGIVCGHLANVYRDGRARDQIERLEDLTSANFIEMADGEQVEVFALSDAGKAIEKGHKDARITVFNWLELRRAGADPDEAHAILGTWTRAQLKDWTKAVNVARMRLLPFSDVHIDEVQKLNIERLEIIIRAIGEAGATGTLSAKQIHEAAQKSLSRIEATAQGDILHRKFDRITQAEALSIAKAAFHIERTSYRREYQYKIGHPWKLEELEELIRTKQPITFSECITPVENPQKSVQRLTRSFVYNMQVSHCSHHPI